MFEKASKLKLRFASKRGYLSTEDLWDIPLTNEADLSLDNLAKTLSREIKLSEEESFVIQKSSAGSIMELKLDIVKHIIQVKLKSMKDAEDKVINTTKIQKLQSAIMRKEDASLEDQSLGELMKKLKKLQKTE